MVASKKMVAKFQYITLDSKKHPHSVLARHACQAGVKWIQLRTKGKSLSEWCDIARGVKEVCDEFGAIFIVNDSVEAARAVGADGVHLGKEDMDPVAARSVLGERTIIGGTANRIEDVVDLWTKEVDYVGLGPYRFTSTKEKLNPVLGTEGTRRIVDEAKEMFPHLPIIAIGGIAAQDIEGLMATGVHGVAVSSAISSAVDKESAASEFLKEMGVKENGAPAVRRPGV